MLVKSSFIYFIVVSFNALTSFLLVFVYSKYLSVEEYGLYGILMVIFSIVYVFIHSNLPNLLSREFYRSQKKLYYISSILIYYIVMFFIISLLIIISHNVFIQFFGVKLDLDWILFINIIALLKVIMDLFFSIMRLRFILIKFLILNIMLNILIFIISYLLVQRYSWKGIFIASFLVYFLYDLIFIINNFKYFKFKFKFLKDVFIFAIKYIPTTLNWRIIAYSDRFFILKLLGVSYLGLYTFASQISSIFNLIINAVNQAWGPYFMKNFNSINKKHIIFILLGSIGLFLVIYIFIYFFINFVNPSYKDAFIYVKYFLVISFFSLFHYLISKYLIFFKKENKISLYTFIGVIVNLILNYILIKYLELVGVLVATILSYVVIVFLEWNYAKKEQYV